MQNYFASERQSKRKLQADLEKAIREKEKELKQLRNMQLVARNMKNIESYADES